MKKQFVFLFEVTSCWSKLQGKKMWITADSNKEAQELAIRYKFDWSCMSRYSNNQ